MCVYIYILQIAQLVFRQLPPQWPCSLLPTGWGHLWRRRGRLGFCAGDNGEEKLLGNLVLTRGMGMRSLRSSWVGRAARCKRALPRLLQTDG